MTPSFFQGLTAEQINARMIGASQQVVDSHYLDEILTDVAQTTRELAAMPSGFSRASSSLIVASHPVTHKIMQQHPEMFSAVED